MSNDAAKNAARVAEGVSGRHQPFRCFIARVGWHSRGRRGGGEGRVGWTPGVNKRMPFPTLSVAGLAYWVGVLCMDADKGDVSASNLCSTCRDAGPMMGPQWAALAALPSTTSTPCTPAGWPESLRTPRGTAHAYYPLRIGRVHTTEGLGNVVNGAQRGTAGTRARNPSITWYDPQASYSCHSS
ncbi:hypothetical protein BD779DRAFT_1475164 [Infundibulicybe gibba]|nr:hypothetical protein BD779DRAFT_1475164 [Infundibulicybe gibba]